MGRELTLSPLDKPPFITAPFCSARRPLRSGTLFGFGLALALLLSPASPAGAAEPNGPEAEFFEKSVRPLLVEKCGGCHGEVKPKGGLKLTSRAEILRGGDNGAAIVPGKPDESLLIKAVRYQDEPRMPPKGKLTDRQIEVLEKWVKSGAPWPGAKAPPAPADGRFAITEKHRQFWSFQPVEAGPPPAVRDRGLAPVRRSTGSSSRSWKRRDRSRRAGRQADAPPPGDLRPDRPAADARGDRRVPGRRFARRRSRRSWIACSPRRSTASAGGGTGSTSSATPTPAT